MLLQGSISKDGGFWLAEIPLLDALTQGETPQEALEMAVDWVETMVNQDGFRAHIASFSDTSGAFFLGVSDTDALLAFALQRLRASSGMTARAAAEVLGETSPNAFSRYEHGHRSPSIVKLESLVRAVAPEQELVLSALKRPE